MKTKVLVSGFVFLFALSVASGQVGNRFTSYLVVNEDGSPVKILEVRRSTYNNCCISFKNISDKKIVAVAFEVLHFDPFNRNIHTSYGIAICKKEKHISPQQVIKGGAWSDKELSFVPLISFNAIAYVSDVRFEDDSLWKANTDFVKERVKELVHSDVSELIKDTRSSARKEAARDKFDLPH